MPSSRLLPRNVYIFVLMFLVGSAKTSYYFSYFGGINFSMIPEENVIRRSKVSLVKCSLECINEGSCASIMYCSFQSEEKVCLLARSSTGYNRTAIGYECQIYRVKCHNGGSYETNLSTCSCPPRTGGRFCQYMDIDCQDYVNVGGSGIYRLEIKGTKFNAYCDMETDGGGWTVIQRRKDGSVDFLRTWTEFENGFGALDAEFWLGNRFIHDLTSSVSYRIRIDMEYLGVPAYAEYNVFRISDAEDKYRLELGTYTAGNAGDSLSYQNGARFTTKDADNDQNAHINCAVLSCGAWWHKSCHFCNLNGEYGNTGYGKGVNWQTFIGYKRSLTKVLMKIKRN